jgi:hypothetical protein
MAHRNVLFIGFVKLVHLHQYADMAIETISQYQPTLELNVRIA